MTDSARQLLVDKADTYLGGDEVVTVVEVLDVPSGLTGTVVGRLAARSDGLNVEVLGVDPATFAAAVRYREDGSASSMAEMLDSIDVDAAASADGAPLPALLAGGGLGGTTLETYNREQVAVEPVGTADWFPGQHAGSTLVVVDRDALIAAGGDLAEEVWLRDPPADARARLAAADFTVRGSVRSADVFDVISFLAVKWSYSALRAFGIVIAVVIVLAQLLVLDARRRSRQSAFVLTKPMGSTGRRELGATVTELSVPLLAGAVLAIPFSLLVLAIAVPRFDTLRQLAPPARVVVDEPALLTALAVAALAVVALAAVATIGVVRARPMKVMRSGT
jgi:putative ABC transport system permease protein